MMVRSFYGGLRVYEDNDPEDFLYQRGLTHGTISHGAQYLQPYRSNLPTTYFGPNSGAGLAVMNAGRSSPQRVGVIGLGVGVMAAYSRSGDYYRFYEIDPLVIHLAQTQFTFLKDAKAKVDVVLGDARLSLEREPSQNFDLLAVDAFSSDSVPVHLLTKEALALYFRHLKAAGVLCVQVSNRFLDLSPVVELSAKAIGKQALLIEDDSDEEFSSTSYVLVTGDRLFFERPIFRQRGIAPHRRPGLRTWTDDYSNLFRILK
jgi:SAM-dependent methyltransferase